MERPRSGPSERRAAVALIDPNEQTTLQAGSDTKLRRTLLAAYFRIADFTSEPKAYRARNRRFESISLQQTVRLSWDFSFLCRKGGSCRGVRGPR